MNKYLIAGIVIVLFGGAGYWMWMQNFSPSTVPETSTVPVTNQNSQNTPYSERAPLNSTPNNQEPAVRVQILGLASKSSTVLPVVQYRIDSNVSGNGYINLVSKSSGTTIWGMEQEPTGAHSLDLNTFTRLGDYSAIKVPDGDYFLRVQDRSGNLLAESAIFHVAPGMWYFYQSSVPVTSTTNETPTTQSYQPASQTDATAGWKTYINSRDGYSVKYPSEEIAGAPSTDCCSDLSQFGFEKSMSFMRYGGWADIYIFNGSSDKAIAAYKKVDGENRVYNSTENMVIGGKSGTVVSWTNILGSPSDIQSSYLVEYRPGKTLLISGSKEFLTTIKFL